MANAVVRAAKERGISHEEMHSEVEYICLLYTSTMNVTFTSPNADLDKKFCAEAAEAGFVNLKDVYKRQALPG